MSKRRPLTEAELQYNERFSYFRDLIKRGQKYSINNEPYVMYEVAHSMGRYDHKLHCVARHIFTDKKLDIIIGGNTDKNSVNPLEIIVRKYRMLEISKDKISAALLETEDSVEVTLDTVELKLPEGELGNAILCAYESGRTIILKELNACDKSQIVGFYDL